MPWTLTSTWLADIGRTAPRTPETSMLEPVSAKTRLPAADGDLAALRHGLRLVLEVDHAAGDDLDARLVLAIRQNRQIVERPRGAGGAQQIGCRRRSDQRIALAASSAVSLLSSSGRMAVTLFRSKRNAALAIAPPNWRDGWCRGY